MIDAHVHVTADLLPYLTQVRCIANADSPDEYRFLKRSGLPCISAGIHPWKADTTDFAQMEPILREAPVIGEIGLDSVWCGVDMDTQRSVFCRQLELASALHKPVILHTKGMEREVLDIIRSYPNRYLVHWYACGDHLAEYIALGCWFTVAPDVLLDKDVERLARTVPLHRLLIESDGIEGIAWGQGKDLTPAEYPTAMQQHLETIANLRGITADGLLHRMTENLDHFLK